MPTKGISRKQARDSGVRRNDDEESAGMTIR
jgi:hypothetical protein